MQDRHGPKNQFFSGQNKSTINTMQLGKKFIYKRHGLVNTFERYHRKRNKQEKRDHDRKNTESLIQFLSPFIFGMIN